MYHRDAILLVDVVQSNNTPSSDSKLEYYDESEVNDLNVFNQDHFSKILNNMINIRDVLEDHTKKI